MESQNFEGAGFLLFHKHRVILGITEKHVEYIGGKVETYDGIQETPYQTAYAELIEEVGGEVLDDGWRDRATPLHLLQPVIQKWIWCFQLELNDQEFQRLVRLDQELDNWSLTEERNFSTLTGRKPSVKKSLQGLVEASKEDLLDYITRFQCAQLAHENRMLDAKLFGQVTALFKTRRLSQNQFYEKPLRGFNLVLLEQNIDKIDL